MAAGKQHPLDADLMQEKRRGRTIRLLIDIWMTAGLMFSMGYQLFTPFDHEWAGAVLLVLFVCHHIVNRRWYSSLFRGRYTALRSVSTAADAAMLVFIILLMWSGIAMSQYVYPLMLLQLPGRVSLMRRLHLISSGWAFVLMAFHLGLHWHLVMTGRREEGRRGRILFWLGAAVAVYGLYVFQARDFLGNMFLLNEFAFLDYDESPLRFYLDYLAVFGTFIFTGYGIRQLLRRRKRTRASAAR